MGKYDSQVNELKTGLTAGKKALIALPAQISVDKLASSLALILSLKSAGIGTEIVTEGTPLVAHTNLYGIGEVKNSLTSAGAGNFQITLENVVESNGQISSLEKLDWYPEGSNLNLVFHVLPGKTFQPTNVIQKFAGSSNGSFDFIFVIGASNLNELGSISQQNTQVFSSGQLINIDTNPQNTNFGKINIVDPNSSSTSEIIAQLIADLGLKMDEDIASNIVAGIYDATSNLTQNVKSDTFMVLGQAMQAGGKLPQAGGVTQPVPSAQPLILQPEPVAAPPTSQPAQAAPIAPIQPEPTSSVVQNPFLQNLPPDQGFDLSKVFGAPINAGPAQETFVSPPVAPTTPVSNVGTNQQSQEERPTGEFAVSNSPESETNPAPDWLTPKIFKGGSLG